MITIDMKMPTCCMMCPMADHEIDDHTESIYCFVLNADVSHEGFKGKSERCPLKEV